MSKFKIGDVWIDGKGRRVRIVGLDGDGLNKKWPIVGRVESMHGTRLFDAAGGYDVDPICSLISKING